MITYSDLSREALFLAKKRYLLIFFLGVSILSLFAVFSGVLEIKKQQDTIEHLLKKDEQDRKTVLAEQKNYGGAAYYSFHLTYSPPSDLAFAAMGQRDVLPWKHRIRMLALEGQIYETDADNPELAFWGRFDFAFLVSILLPLFVILLLHNIRSSEKELGRYELLAVSARKPWDLWLARALVLTTALAVAVLVPFIIGAVVTGSSFSGMIAMVAVTLAHLLFWAVLTFCFGSGTFGSIGHSSQIAAVLLGIWLLVSIIVPVIGSTIVKKIVPSPKGGEIVLTQREAVNEAWDLPVSKTWDAFLAGHPEWSEHTKMESLFEWKWYYAFQQVGDEKAAELSHRYRDAIRQRDEGAGMVALFSPPLLAQRLMASIGETDIKSYLQYEQRVRDYHRSLRFFYYPLLFKKVEFEKSAFGNRPKFSPHALVQ